MSYVITKVDSSGEKATVFIKNEENEAKVMSIDLTEESQTGSFSVQMKLGVVVYNALMSQINENTISDDVLEDLNRADQIILEMAEKGDPSAQHGVAMTYIHRSVKEKNLDLLNQAEGWLKRSSKSGYVRAEKFLSETWPELKVDYRNRILDSK